MDCEEADSPRAGPDPARLEDDSSRQRRRLDDSTRRRHRRAAARDLDRQGLREVAGQNQEVSVGDMLSLLRHDAPLTAADLRRVKRALAQSSETRVALLRTAGSQDGVGSIVNQLTGSDPDSQLEATACLTNLAAGAVSPELVRAAGGYLVTLAGSGNHLLQDQCVWALGNMAASGAEICSLLAAQGMPGAAISCLKSQHGTVRESTATALGVFLTKAAAEDASRLSEDLLPALTPLLRLDAPQACFCLASAAASPASDTLLSVAPSSLVPAVTGLLLECLEAGTDPSLATLRSLTHLVRALAALVLQPAAGVGLLRQPAALRLLTALLRHRSRHVQREALLLVANLVYAESDEVRAEAEAAMLRRRLASHLEEVYKRMEMTTELPRS